MICECNKTTNTEVNDESDVSSQEVENVEKQSANESKRLIHQWRLKKCEMQKESVMRMDQLFTICIHTTNPTPTGLKCFKLIFINQQHDEELKKKGL